MSTANRTVHAIFLAGINIDATENKTQMRNQAEIIRISPGISLLTDLGSLQPPLPVRAPPFAGPGYLAAGLSLHRSGHPKVQLCQRYWIFTKNCCAVLSTLKGSAYLVNP